MRSKMVIGLVWCALFADPTAAAKGNAMDALGGIDPLAPLGISVGMPVADAKAAAGALGARAREVRYQEDRFNRGSVGTVVYQSPGLAEEGFVAVVAAISARLGQEPSSHCAASAAAMCSWRQPAAGVSSLQLRWLETGSVPAARLTLTPGR